MDDFPINSCVVSLVGEKDDECIFSSGSIYSVPAFQRPYAWDEKNIDDLLESIFDGYETQNFLFLGTVQYMLEKVNTSVKHYSVIDGQQRMTTIMLLIHVIEAKMKTKGADSLFKKYNIGLNLDDLDITAKQMFEESLKCKYEDVDLVSSKKSDKMIFDKENNRYKKNLRLLKTKIECYEESRKKEKKNYDDNDLSSYIINKVYFVKLITKRLPLPQVVSIFNTINTTGMDLNSSDVFKLNYYEYLRKKNPNQSDIMKSINASYSKIEMYNINGKKVSMTEVLDAYKHIIVAYYELGWERLKKVNETFFSDLFNEKYDEYKSENRKSDYSILEFDVFDLFVDIYIDFHRALENADQNQMFNKGIEIYCEKVIKETRYSRYSSLPYVSAFFELWKNKLVLDEKRYDCYKKATEQATAVSKYLIVCSVNYDKVINPVQTFVCGKVLPALAECDDVKAIIDGVICQSPYTISNSIVEKDNIGKDEFYRRLNGDIFANSRSWVLCIYSALIDEVEAKTSTSKIISLLFDWGNPIHRYDREHILSQEKFKDCSEKEKQLFNSIGNLVLLESSINRSIKDSDVKDKVEVSDNIGYDKSKFKIIDNVINSIKSNNNKWDANSIAQRRDKEIKKIATAIGFDAEKKDELSVEKSE